MVSGGRAVVRRVGVLSVALALLAAACGGGGNPLATTPETGEATREQSAAAITTLVDRWDDRLAFYAVMAAFDRGYSVDQVVEHAGSLLGDGSIPGVGPAEPAIGMLSPLPAGDAAALPAMAAAPRRLVAARAEGDPRDQHVRFVNSSLGAIFEAGRNHLDRLAARERLAEVLAGLRDEGFVEYVVGLTILLRATGYGPQQIVEAIILGTIDVGVDGPTRCVVIPDGDGKPIRPQGTPRKWIDQLCPGVFAADDPDAESTTTTSGLDPDCDPVALGRELFAHEAYRCYQALDPPTMAIIGARDVEVGTFLVLGATISGGRPPFDISLDWGDGSEDAVQGWTPTLYAGTASRDYLGEHAYLSPGTYTVTFTLLDAEGRLASASAALTVATPDLTGRYVGTVLEAVDIERGDSVGITYTNNRVVVVIDGTVSELRRYTIRYEVTYTMFTTGGGSAQADCLGTGRRTLRSADLSFSGSTTLHGTVEIREQFSTEGSQCPFGGSNYTRDWTGVVEGEFIQGVLHLTFVLNHPDRPTETWTVEAPLDTTGGGDD